MTYYPGIFLFFVNNISSSSQGNERTDRLNKYTFFIFLICNPPTAENFEKCFPRDCGIRVPIPNATLTPVPAPAVAHTNETSFPYYFTLFFIASLSSFFGANGVHYFWSTV